MPAYEFIIRYRELSHTAGTWDEGVLSLGEWPDTHSLPADKIENHPEVNPKWFSVQLCVSGTAGTSFNAIQVLAKDSARTALRQHYPDAKLY